MRILLIDLLTIVAQETGVSIETLISQTKNRTDVDARRIAITILFKRGYKADVLADIFSMDRASVYKGIERTNQLVRIYPSVKELYEKCEGRLTA